ncbi:MAG: hypothetical protein DBX59_04830 [Bacillota bacterium]|nr:MAG: hypothetical protein DBX59_04830 [Bacillota bacterium]
MLNYHTSLTPQINAEPPRADFLPLHTKTRLLSEWSFSYRSDFDGTFAHLGETEKITVPSCWQMLGYDGNRYMNFRYPFPFDPPHIRKKNPCGIYTCALNVEKREDKSYYLLFGGVDSCFYLLINGEFVGYSSVSHSPAEFDVTKYLKAENEITLAVLKYNSGSYLEDQDKLRMSGILREITFIERPKKHLRDFTVHTDAENGEGVVSFTAEEPCALELSYRGKTVARAEGKTAVLRVKNPALWSAETPELYTLKIECLGETIIEDVAIRRIEQKDGVLLLNGKPVKFKGVNRHSVTVNGYTETIDDIVNDLKLMKANNVNAIRTSHYPPHPELPRLCDRMGIYLLEEADIECHGTVMEDGRFKDSKHNVLAEDERFTDLFVHRVARMYERDKNRGCILIWSLANESGWGENLIKCAEWLRAKDKTRLLHYEGAWNYEKPVYHKENVLDMYSRMYAPIDWMKKFVKKADRPLILCEYAHSMENTGGDTKDYWDAIYAHRKMCGGFIWEWCNHNIIKDGKVLYGPDFDKDYHDDVLCMDGILTTDRIPNPSFYEMAAVYAPVTVAADGEYFVVTNRRDFLDLGGVLCTATLRKNGETVGETTYKLGKILPHRAKRFPLPACDKSGYTVCDFLFAEGGKPIATAQLILSDNLPCPVTGKEGSFAVNGDGLLSALVADGRNLLAAPMKILAGRACTDNDKYSPLLFEWELMGCFLAEFFPVSVEKEGDVCRTRAVFSNDGQRPMAELDLAFAPANGGVEITLHAKIGKHVTHLPRFGVSLPVDPSLTQIEYFGRGPEEAYIDRHAACPVGYYQNDTKHFNYSYPHPQECGSRCNSRYVALHDGKKGVAVYSEQDFSFQITPYELADYKPHAFEMQNTGKLFLNVDYFMAGAGYNSLGEKEKHRYLLTEKDFTLKFTLFPFEKH